MIISYHSNYAHYIYINIEWKQKRYIYSEQSNRLKSFGTFPYAADLSEAGAYSDSWYHEKIQGYKCYECDYKFNVDEIRWFSRLEGLELRFGGMMMHLTANPCCDFFRRLSNNDQSRILGKYQYFLLLFSSQNNLSPYRANAKYTSSFIITLQNIATMMDLQLCMLRQNPET